MGQRTPIPAIVLILFDLWDPGRPPAHVRDYGFLRRHFLCRPPVKIGGRILPAGLLDVTRQRHRLRSADDFADVDEKTCSFRGPFGHLPNGP